MDIRKLDFITFLTITLITETIFLTMFRFSLIFTNWAGINKWYNKFGWTGILLDCLSILAGFYIAKYIYILCVDNGFIIESKNYMINILKFLGIILVVQILHDILFYLLIINPTKKNKNKLIDEFKEYAKKAGFQAILGDSSMYIVSILFLIIVNKLSDDTKTFLSILFLYILGYLLYQNK
jgi:hypothetical protein